MKFLRGKLSQYSSITLACVILSTLPAIFLWFASFSGNRLPADPSKGLAVIFLPWVFPAVMLSGWGNVLKNRLSLMIMVITAISSGLIMIGTLSGWLGQSIEKPRISDEGHIVKVSGKRAYAVYIKIQNEGDSPLKLRLTQGTNPEAGYILSAQRYSDSRNEWTEYPMDKLLSERSRTMFPVEIRPGGTMIMEMIFLSPDLSEQVNLKNYNASGRYTISIIDQVHMRIYHHEIHVPDFLNSPA